MKRWAARLIAWLVPGLLSVPAAFGADGFKTLAPWTGGATPALALRDVSGAPQDLARHRGKVVLVNFWATWCEPCREEMPSIQRLRERLSGKPFVVLAVNVDEPEARVRRFLEETRFDLPVLFDPGKTATRAWGVRVMPTTFVVGPDGRIRYRLLGDIDWSADAVVSTLSQLMPGS
jgi:thiol-disulfide isomerase/thioredoxin